MYAGLYTDEQPKAVKTSLYAIPIWSQHGMPPISPPSYARCGQQIQASLAPQHLPTAAEYSCF